LNKNNQSFGKELKLCSLKRISEVFTNGKTIFSHPLKVFYLPNGKGNSQVLVSVPKRSFKKAVQRNRIKRVMRDSLRLNDFNGSLPGGYDICIVYLGKELPLHTQIDQKIVYVLEKIKKGIEKDPGTPICDNH